jgi:pilus assembly protein CpaD
MTGQAQMEFVKMNRRILPAGASAPIWPIGRVLAVLAAALAGCTHMQTAKIDRHVIVGSVPEDYRTTHPIAVEEGVETLDVPAGLNAVGLTSGVRDNIRGFAQAFLASGSAAIAIVTPAGSTNQAAARALASQIRAELLATHVDPQAIQFHTYRAEPSEVTAPIRLAYSKIGAHTAGCGPWPDQFNRNTDNRNYFNYGCATQQNLAAMVANPLDLLYPRSVSPPDATRRVGVLGNYEGAVDAPLTGATQGNYGKEPSATIFQGVP